MASAQAIENQASEGATVNEVPAPRPARPEDIARMLEEAEARATGDAASEETDAAGNDGGILKLISLVLLWGGIGAALAATVYLATTSISLEGTSLVVVLVMAFMTGALLTGAAMRFVSPGFLSGVMLRRVAGADASAAVELASSDMLAALGIAEKVLDADVDARLVTRRDGVVIYANGAYTGLAREAGVIGPAGLPPRIDRLFAQQGAEATKIFRLCRAAKSAAPADEIIYQVMGLRGGRRRRFEVSVRPVSGGDEFVAWRLRELPVEEEEHDVLAASFADFTRPVFAMERSGQVAWANAAMRARLGAERGALNHIDDVVLGETADLIRALCQVDQAPQKAKIRRRGADPADAAFTAFRRGGVGEGFVCVELAIDEDEGEDEDVSISGDMTEAPFGVAVIEGDIGADARIVEANKAFTDVFGGGKKNAPLARSLDAKTIEELAAEIRRKSSSGGAPRPVETGAGAASFAVYARPVRRKRGSYGPRRTLLYTVDITDRRIMEREHAQDQKLKAIGRLSSEVAHDFNNVLQVVLGKCELLMLRHPAGDPAYMDLVLIRQTAQRAANMTKQLLAYAREQTLQREVSSITEILRDFTRFLDGAVGEKVKLELVNGRGLPFIRVDRNQLETAIMNLAVNARDAMGASGGKVTIRTSAVDAETVAALGLPGLAAQPHLLIEITDTGPGVPQEIRDKIFDPFFTTKDVGKGTGLGLSTVHGIIGQMEGVITVDDAPGGGAVFRIYLPAYAGEAEAPAEKASLAAQPVGDLTGAGRILVVEDEDAVRSFVVAALEDRGYEVTAVADGEEALELLADEADGYDLIITDVMMPEVDGPTLVARARAEHSVASKVIFMSAYAENAVREQLSEIEAAGYIQKPFTLKGLAAKVKEALSAAA